MLHKAAFLLLLGFCQAQAITGPDFFTAAVFEHRHRGNLTTDTSEEFIRKNLDFYEKAAKVASQKGTDIIVFNEYGLFPYLNDRKKTKQFMEHIPDPYKGSWNPCNNQDLFGDRQILVTLSCLAKKHKMVVVANMGDMQPCEETQYCDTDNTENCKMNNEKCPDDGAFLYNTNVAFDREGTLIARYHKVHPYFEIVNSPKTAEYSTFETDFGIFGMIICFDFVFKESVILAEDYGIENLIYPTLWFDDELPFTGVEFQQAWSLTNRVNFLAANGHNPVLGTLGSGIYSKDLGALTYTYNPDGHSKLLIAKVPRKEGIGKPLTDEETEVIIISEKGVTVEDEDGDGFPEHCYNVITEPPKDELRDYRCYKSQTAKYALSKLKNPSGELEVCNNGMCCSVKYSASSMDEDYYLAVFNGTNDANDFYFWCEETCLLVRCDPLENKPCITFPAKSKTVFNSVEMKSSFTTEYVYPTVSKNNKRLAPKTEWNFKVSKNSATLRYQSASSEPLLKVGLLGRCYDRDPPFKPWF